MAVYKVEICGVNTSRLPLLTAEEKDSLWEKIKAGDKEARERLFAPGHGGGHEPDEALNLRLFVEAMKIYACAIAALNDVEL